MAKAKTAREVFDKLSVKAVSAVSDRVDREGELAAYDGIEAAREIREMMLAAHNRLIKRAQPKCKRAHWNGKT
jgi:hypothetical protein